MAGAAEAERRYRVRGRVGGTILRGSGRVAAGAVGAATATVWAGAAGALGGAAGGWPRRCMAAASLGFLFLLLGQDGLHHVAGLGDVGEIDLGCNGLGGARRSAAAVGTRRVPRSKCARTFSASSSSSELEWVLPAARPSSANTSRICRLLTSISRARSLIRTLLIRLFSESAAQSP